MICLRRLRRCLKTDVHNGHDVLENEDNHIDVPFHDAREEHSRGQPESERRQKRHSQAVFDCREQRFR
jgi:hypothetical protein